MIQNRMIQAATLLPGSQDPLIHHKSQKAPMMKLLLRMTLKSSRTHGLGKSSKKCSQHTILLWRCGMLELSSTR